ncbi:MAG: hypothetical protein MUD12_09010 [Spirochaetes bacterium]|nr:hypothetical protein [Spirochaetota bacterium]
MFFKLNSIRSILFSAALACLTAASPCSDAAPADHLLGEYLVCGNRSGGEEFIAEVSSYYSGEYSAKIIGTVSRELKGVRSICTWCESGENNNRPVIGMTVLKFRKGGAGFSLCRYMDLTVGRWVSGRIYFIDRRQFVVAPAENRPPAEILSGLKEAAAKLPADGYRFIRRGR